MSHTSPTSLDQPGGERTGADAGATAPPPARRIVALDLLRGLMVALMVLDHTREYFSAQALQFDPLDASKTTAWLFGSRWITHLCAPTFVFLAGASVHLQRAAGKSEGAIRRQLVLRGMWLILLEVTVIGFAFNFGEPFLFLQVIWAIGVGMVMLAPCSLLPAWVVAALGAGSIALTPWLTAETSTILPPLPWHLLLVPGPIAPLPGVAVYPLLPWFGVLALGYAAGPLLSCPAETLRNRSLIAGAVLLAAFALLRVLAIGDVRTGGGASDRVLRLLTYVDVSKYPPSLQYVCLTLGVSALLLAAFTWPPTARLTTLHAFGSAPFFTYVLHIYLVHGLAMAVGLLAGVPAAAFTHFIESTAGLKAAGWGFDLPAVYLFWVAVLLVLRPLSVRFAAIKRRRGRWWLSYL